MVLKDILIVWIHVIRKLSMEITERHYPNFIKRNECNWVPVNITVTKIFLLLSYVSHVDYVREKGCVIEDLPVFFYLEFLYLQQLLHFCCMFQHCTVDWTCLCPSILWYVKNRKFLNFRVTYLVKAGNHKHSIMLTDSYIYKYNINIIMTIGNYQKVFVTDFY
jgi:hypothetical protein